MDTEKRKIIVKEIEQWRRSRLLPEHYCDFLKNLYDDEGEKPRSVMGVSAASISDSNWKPWLVVLAIISAISYSVLNFNSFGISLQIGISALFVVLCYVFAFLQRNKNPIVTPLLCGVASGFMLFIGIYLLHNHGVDSPFAYVSYVAFCSIVWLLTGILGRLGMFHFCGWAGLLFTYGWLLANRFEEPGWGILEISWLPICLIFIWIAWLVHHKNKQTAGILFIVGCLACFAPEGFGLLVNTSVANELIQLSFLCKMIAAGVILFLLRKKWIEWVM